MDVGRAAETVPLKVALARRGPLPAAEVGAVAELFKVLSSPTRIRLLHVLVREGEAPVGEIARELGATPQAVLNQLQKLAVLGIVGSRRVGREVRYRIADPCVALLLDKALCLVEDSGGRLEPQRARRP